MKQKNKSERMYSVGRMAFLLVSLVFVTTIESCQAPTLSLIAPRPAFPRQILQVSGTDLLGASLVWDIGTPTEQTALQAFLSPRYFQVPRTTLPGNHSATLRNSEGNSATETINVMALSGTWPAPRIEEISLANVQDNNNGTANIWLFSSVANVDPDAQVQVGINGGVASAQPTILYSAITTDYFSGHTGSTFNYPVYHYGGLITFLENIPFSGNLTVTVINSDGLSNSKNYMLANSAANVDSDNDGLLDTWETNGFTAASGNVINLANMGCNPKRKDILIEIDWIAAAAPNAGLWAGVENAFADAPTLNPDGSSGISIHLDRGQGGAFTGGGTILANHTTMDFGTSTSPGYTNFFTYKSGSFNADRLNIFHYCVFGRVRPSGSSGRGEIWGNDFMVTFTTFTEWASVDAQIGTFIHELGHNLGLRHGGIDNAATDADETNKPNQESTMNYRYQFSGASIDCDFTTEIIHTYSQGMRKTINETSVNENAGICDNQALDMNGSGTFTSGRAIDTNFDGVATDIHQNYNEWGNLKLNFTATGSRWLNN